MPSLGGILELRRVEGDGGLGGRARCPEVGPDEERAELHNFEQKNKCCKITHRISSHNIYFRASDRIVYGMKTSPGCLGKCLIHRVNELIV